MTPNTLATSVPQRKKKPIPLPRTRPQLQGPKEEEGTTVTLPEYQHSFLPKLSTIDDEENTNEGTGDSGIAEWPCRLGMYVYGQ